jgi:hypothetical protein
LGLKENATKLQEANVEGNWCIMTEMYQCSWCLRTIKMSYFHTKCDLQLWHTTFCQIYGCHNTVWPCEYGSCSNAVWSNTKVLHVIC